MESFMHAIDRISDTSRLSSPIERKLYARKSQLDALNVVRKCYRGFLNLAEAVYLTSTQV